ncbi:hypothetical protein EIN_246940 [Entamoeba invadens IP1]|uniref:U3 small nucleolar RNA-associated protein 6 n=1 Tax=Entamoeba invadens IP1 TaxID=370355 RepID=A0A0A1UDY3_ENTIV|nr:hypothetical protein EIN_246940 [Entamoeba invadens IP1]ELP94800.1 hypothetical protein EIN_246940 [Entamoeba invadens IP1]|eukprot:XP_004261571.1 hypothetical protein EIN_246940 [Entamoeba invadens IP1]
MERLRHERENYLEMLLPLVKLGLYTSEEVRKVIDRWTKQDIAKRRYKQEDTTFKMILEQEKEARKDFIKRVSKYYIKELSEYLVFDKRISDTFVWYLNRFPIRVLVWKDYIAFLIESEHANHEVLNAFTKAFKFNPRCDELWTLFTTYLSSMPEDNYRKVLQSVIANNPYEEEVYLMYFRFELDQILTKKKVILFNTDLVEKKEEQIKEQQIKYAPKTTIAHQKLLKAVESLTPLYTILRIIYEEAKSKLKGYHYVVGMIDSVYDVPECEELKKTMLEYLFSMTDKKVDIMKELALTYYERNPQLGFEVLKNPVFNDVSEKAKEKVFNEMRGLSGEEVKPKLPYEISIEKIKKIADLNAKLNVMKTEILNIDRTYIEQLKDECFDIIMVEEESVVKEFIDWLLKTVCSYDTYIKMAKYFEEKKDYKSALNVFDTGVRLGWIAKGSAEFWVEYLLLCRNSGDYKRGRSVHEAMKKLYKNPDEVDVMFESRVNN